MLIRLQRTIRAVPSIDPASHLHTCSQSDMPAMSASRSILIAVDESDASAKTFAWALDNIYRAGDRVCLVHVIPPGQHIIVTPDLGVEGIIEDDEATKRAMEEHAQEFLRTRFESKLDALKIPYQVDILRASMDNETIGSIICKRAENMQAGIVVLAKHTRGAIKEFFVGSVTNYCTHRCKQPVLVLHVD